MIECANLNLKEAEEESVNCHVVNTKERAGIVSSERCSQNLYNWHVPCNAVASDDNEDHGGVDVVEAGYLVLDVGHVAGEGEIGDGPRQKDDNNLAEEEEEVNHAV